LDPLNVFQERRIDELAGTCLCVRWMSLSTEATATPAESPTSLCLPAGRTSAFEPYIPSAKNPALRQQMNEAGEPTTLVKAANGVKMAEGGTAAGGAGPMNSAREGRPRRRLSRRTTVRDGIKKA
jgi:hypothetical protein